MAQFDVLIAGAGPAGAATAISLGDFAPDLRVALVDAQANELRVGETLPPQVEPILRHLKVWDAFAADGHRPSFRTVSAWGGPELLSNEFIFQTAAGRAGGARDAYRGAGRRRGARGLAMARASR